MKQNILTDMFISVSVFINVQEKGKLQVYERAFFQIVTFPDDV